MKPYARPTKQGKALEAAGRAVPQVRPYVVWVLRYRDAYGTLQRKASKARTEVEATRAQLAQEAAEEDIRTGRATRQQVSRATWEEVLAAYLEANPDIAAHGPFQSMVRVWFSPHFRGQPVAAITPSQCERLLGKAKREGLADSTVRQLHVRASAIFQHAVKLQRVLVENPWRAVPRPDVEKKDPVWLTHAQVQALLEKAGEYQLLLLAAVLTGLRRGELAGLRWEDVDFSHGTLGALYVRRSFEGRRKTRRAHLVPLHPVLREALGQARVRARGPLVFPSPKTGGVRHHTWHAAELLRDIARRAGVELPAGTTFHSLRKTFGTHLSVSAGDVAATQRLLDHSSPVITTESYFGRDVSHLEGAILQMPGFSTHKTSTQASGGDDGTPEFLGSPSGHQQSTALSTMERAVPSPDGAKVRSEASTGQTRSHRVARLPQKEGAGVRRTHVPDTEVTGGKRGGSGHSTKPGQGDTPRRSPTIRAPRGSTDSRRGGAR